MTIDLAEINNQPKLQKETPSILYDTNGNLRQDDQGLQYQYNALNQVTTLFKTASQPVAHYLYDGLGQQIACLIPDQPPHHRFFSQYQQINETQGNWISYGLTGHQGTLHRTVKNQTKKYTEFMVTDHQKSPIYTIQDSHISKMSYQPFGKHFP